MSLNKMFDEFNELYGLTKKPVNHDLNSMYKLISDEVEELSFDIDFDKGSDCIIKEAIDTIYITCQQLRERGVNVEAALAEVHRSNMSKQVLWSSSSELETAKRRYPNAELVENGEILVMKCADTGKVIKPTTYSPAVITPEMWSDTDISQEPVEVVKDDFAGFRCAACNGGILIGRVKTDDNKDPYMCDKCGETFPF